MLPVSAADQRTVLHGVGSRDGGCQDHTHRFGIRLQGDLARRVDDDSGHCDHDNHHDHDESEDIHDADEH